MYVVVYSFDTFYSWMEPLAQEVEQEDLALQVADAPSVAVNRVATYKEHTYVTSPCQERFYLPFVLYSKMVKRLDIHVYRHGGIRRPMLSRQGVTKRCRLSLLTSSALVYEPKCGGRGELRGLSQ
jgi:hypothetical protein